MQKIQLPIFQVLDQLKDALTQNNKAILQAPPGAGKSTMVPISLLDEAWLEKKMIIMLEPRRVAARMVARQMAKLLGEKLGERVGYQVKMQSVKSHKTQILVVTEAILVRMIQSDETLSGVALVIFDEFHERNIYSDLSLALALQVQDIIREDLKVLIMSATLNAVKLCELLGDVPVITSEGKSYDVAMHYLDIKTKQPDAKTLHTATLNAVKHAYNNDRGDILVFLAGVREIQKLQTALNAVIDLDESVVLPLYSALEKKEQDLALEPLEKRKIILATNIAQTSLTIAGVRVVIDSGVEKLASYNTASAMNHLDLAFISKDSATQRAGRAGRTANGKCYRLWHESKILQESTKPEILRSDLSATLLDLALWGVEDFKELQWMDIPSQKSIDAAKEVLQELQMLDENFKITAFGKDALSLGVHPRFAYMILKANDFAYAYEASLLCAILSEKEILKAAFRESDLATRFILLYEKEFDNAHLNRFRAKEVLKQAEFFYKKLQKIKKVKQRTKPFSQEMLGVLLLLAYPDRLAKQRSKDDNRYILSNEKGAILHFEESLFNEPYLVVAKLFAKSHESIINGAVRIDEQYLEKYFSHLIETKETILFNKETQKIEIRQNRYFLKLLLDSKPMPSSAVHDYKKLFLELLKSEGLDMLHWSKKAISLRQRVAFINLHMQGKIANLSDTALLENLDLWLAPYIEGIKSIKALQSLDMYKILLYSLSWQEQQELDKLAPMSIKVPSGSNIFIDYTEPNKPSLSVKIQEVFGLNETPKILNTVVPLQIQLLSPAMRPIQITYDLRSFWENSYAEVRSELRGKYKRHYWPENPFEAVATSKTKKNM
ncbi:ATP-dependent helicase HrpB [Sulfurimonas sp.]|uniref:ATP-dependent helicase HrpB n=1 Tax=Sulfurimonas sp. TaxID=2022749 RepID=UPI00261CF61D|nr:ATP-dependent helicase HrpB [Sulfurimonas sp.]